MMKLVVLLALLISPVCDGSNTVSGREGDDITLPCHYDIKANGPLAMCWSRGELPSSGCGQEVASTDGRQVTGSAPRLRLLGRLEDGDVSLTILNVSLTDAGLYGCRVDIWGWFNDQKHHYDLEVQPAPQTTTLPPETPSVTTEQEEEQEEGGHATGHVTSTELLQTSSSSSSSSSSDSSDSSSSQSAENGLILLLCLLFGFLALIIAVALIIVVRMKRLNKLPQQQIQSRVQSRTRSRTGSRTGSGSAGSGFSLQLRTRDSVVENVYQIEEEGGDYESISSAH